MRIVAGEKGGIKLETLKGDHTRPTADKIKESVFSIIRASIENSDCLDAFGGSGALGLEALSRGASSLVSVDSSRASAKIIIRNIEKLGYKDKAIFILGDVLKKLKYFEENNFNFDLIFVDPPYSKGYCQKFLEKYCYSKVLNENALIVVEHHKTDELLKIYGHFEIYKVRNYGDISISFYRRKM